ncbi:hypothetical protein KNO81_41435 [Paraburkholderia sediminicola]|nr:hypothetical protein [Paraburkholderia sediminicola]
MKFLRLRLIAILLAMGLFAPLVAHAKVPLLFSTGDELFEVGPLPGGLAVQYPNGFKLGYKCSRFALFWTDVWTWDCKLSAVEVHHRYIADLPDEELNRLEEKYSMSDAKRGFWNHYGMAMIGGVLALLFLVGAAKSKN